jgi:hypothetical protein
VNPKNKLEAMKFFLSLRQNGKGPRGCFDLPSLSKPQRETFRPCHVWMAPADQGLFCCGAMIVGAVVSSACRYGF